MRNFVAPGARGGAVAHSEIRRRLPRSVPQGAGYLDIDGKVFLVTGGGSGLGAATARLLASAGGRVVVVDINDAAGGEVAHSLGKRGAFVRADVGDEDDVRLAVATAVSSFGGLHGAANCAGIGVAMKTLGRDGPHRLEAFERVLRVNLAGTFNVIRLAAAQMATQPPDAGGTRRVIVNTASIAAFDGQVGQAAYSASKGGIVGMTLPIARDLGPLGIRIVTIAPGLFDTPLLAGPWSMSCCSRSSRSSSVGGRRSSLKTGRRFRSRWSPQSQPAPVRRSADMRVLGNLPSVRKADKQLHLPPTAVAGTLRRRAHQQAHMRAKAMTLQTLPGTDIPIIQEPMARVQGTALAAAVQTITERARRSGLARSAAGALRDGSVDDALVGRRIRT